MNWLQKKLQKLLGIKPVVINTPICNNKKPIGFPSGRINAKNVSELYKMIGGMSVFAECLHYASVDDKPWYKYADNDNEKRFVLYHRGVKTKSGQPMRKYLDCNSRKQAEDFAAQLLTMYDNDVSRFLH